MKGLFPSDAADDPLATDQSPVLLQHHRRALWALLCVLSMAAPVVVAGLFIREGTTPLMWVGAALALTTWIALITFRLGRVRLAAHIAILSVFVASVLGTAAHGSVRSTSVLIMLAAVVAAGAFLPRATLIATSALSALSLAALNWLEIEGYLPTPNLKVGWAVWIAQVAVLVSMLVSVFYGRHRLMSFFRDQERALEMARRAQIDLLATQDRFEALFRGNPAACLVQSVRTRRVKDVNDAFCRLFGYSRDELEGDVTRHFWAHEEERSGFRKALRSQGRVSGMPAIAIRSDGSQFESVVHGELVKYGNEELLVAMVLDVSAEHSSRRELEKSRERFARAFHHSPICMTLTRMADGQYLEVNAACEGVLGGRPEDYVGKTSLETGVWLNQRVRDDYINTMRREGRLQAYETQIQNRRKEAVDVKVWAEIIDLEGEPCALTFVINEAEEKRRRDMLTSVAKGVSSKTGQAFFLSLAEHIATAVEAHSVIIGETVGDDEFDTLGLLHDGDLQPNCRVALRETTYAELMADDGISVIHAPGTESGLHTPPFIVGGPHTVAGLVLRDPDGSAIGLLAVVWEQTVTVGPDTRALMSIFASRCNAELVRLRRDREIVQLHATLEQRVQARTAQLQYVNLELDAFAYSVSHDLKSPLRSIDGFMHVLQEQMSDRMTQDDEDLVRRVTASVARMNSLITDLLSLARVSQGPLLRMPVDVSGLAAHIIRQEQHRDPTHKAEVVIAPGMVANCDPRLAQIVLENLLGNAWKYSRQQAQPRIELRTIASDSFEPPEFLVQDNGAGFDMSRSDRLFKPFNRLHSANEFEGSGIGLATVRRIIERHGGHISGEGAVGQGAVFRFNFGRDTPE
jgi:PAS domain S-box-containing protein